MIKTVSSLPNVKGIIIDLNAVPQQFRNRFINQGLIGYRIEYLNSDGTITEAEFLKSISNRFDKMDLNSDEVLKKKEIRKALRKIKKQEKRLQDKQKKQPKPFIKQ